MNNSQRDFLMEISKRQRELTAPDFILKDVLSLVREGAILLDLVESYGEDVKVPPGNTALALELATAYQQEGFYPIYVDFDGALFKHRLKNFNGSVLRLATLEQVDQLAEEISSLQEQPVFIIDKVEALLKCSSSTSSLEALLLKFRRLCQNATFVFTGRPIDRGAWTQIVTGSVQRLQTDATHQVVGHLLKVTGPLGSKEVYISYKTGRISRGYEIAKQLREQGVHNYYEYNGLRSRGFWNFVSDYIDRFELVDNPEEVTNEDN